MASLYERLGSSDGINRIAHDLVTIHLKHPYTIHRYSAKQLPSVEKGAANFISTVTGGPANFDGHALPKGKQYFDMEVSEFVTVLDDTLEALKRNNVAQREQEEVLFMLYKMKHALTLT